MDKAKSWSIPKRLVWEAYKRVKANRGAAGVDDQSIEEFEADLKKQSVQALESHVLRQLLPATGKARADRKAGWRKEAVGNSNYF